MSTLTLISAARTVLLDEEAGNGCPVFVAGAVPAKQALPYLVLSTLPSTAQRVAVGTDRASDGVQIDCFASSLVGAADLADSADAIVLGLGTVAADQDASLGLRRADGSWRTVFPTEVGTTGERVVRVALLYTQTDFRTT